MGIESMTPQNHPIFLSLKEDLSPMCHGAEQLRKKIVKSGEAEGKGLVLQLSREVMEDLTRWVKALFERPTGLLPLVPMNSY